MNYRNVTFFVDIVLGWVAVITVLVVAEMKDFAVI
jgi:hypothetical protein